MVSPITRSGWWWCGGGGARKVSAPHVLGPIGICVRRSVKGGGNLIIGAAIYIDITHECVSSLNGHWT